MNVEIHEKKDNKAEDLIFKNELDSYYLSSYRDPTWLLKIDKNTGKLHIWARAIGEFYYEQSESDSDNYITFDLKKA